ncbi:MAG: QueT transporter family protein [Clostridia bacterium]|nr:QueT transporter family protein [Clostridia bacterium]
MKHSNVRYLTESGTIAALYAVLTLLSNAFGLASGTVQIRIADALCILPCFTPAAIPGLTIGCLLSNMLTGCVIWDVIFGSLATLIGAVGARLLRGRPYISWIPSFAANTVIVPFVLSWAYHIGTAIPLMMLTVGLGELISCGVLGSLIIRPVQRNLEHRK